MKILILFMIIIIVCSSSILSQTSHAQDLIIITEIAPPNQYIENGKLTGATVEIIQAVLIEIGMADHKIKVYPWARGYKMLQREKNIALFATSRTALRENLFKWAGPIGDITIGVYKLKAKKDIQAKTLGELKKYKVGGARSDIKAQYLAEKGIEIKLVNKDKQNIAKLLSGRIDVAAFDIVRFKYDIKRWGYNPKKFEILFLIDELSKPHWIAFSKSTDASIVAKFQNGFDKIRNNGTYKEITNKWERTDNN